MVRAVDVGLTLNRGFSQTRLSKDPLRSLSSTSTLSGAPASDAFTRVKAQQDADVFSAVQKLNSVTAPLHFGTDQKKRTYGANVIEVNPEGFARILFKVWAPQVEKLTLYKVETPSPETEKMRKNLLRQIAPMLDPQEKNLLAKRDKIIQALRNPASSRNMFAYAPEADREWAARLLETAWEGGIKLLSTHLIQMARSKEIPVLPYSSVAAQVGLEERPGVLKPGISMSKKGKDFYYEIKPDDKWTPNTRYMFLINGELRPDPYSRFQPKDVHGPSQVTSLNFNWTDTHWQGLPDVRQIKSNRLHVGTFTKEGTFQALEERLKYIKQLGFNAIELMPITEFPGDRNWGYDVSDLYAVENAYGGPEQLAHLVNACHEKGIAVILDMVYNHLSPEGNYLDAYDPFFTTDGSTGWGGGYNWGHEEGKPAQYVFDNVRYWIDKFHVDGFRLDMTTSIPAEALRQIATAAREVNPWRKVFLFAEDGRTEDSGQVTRPLDDRYGLGMDGAWDFWAHHNIKSTTTGLSHGEGHTSLAGMAAQLEGQNLEKSVVMDESHDEMNYGYRNFDRALMSQMNSYIWKNPFHAGAAYQHVQQAVGFPSPENLYSHKLSYEDIKKARYKLDRAGIINAEAIRKQVIWGFLIKYLLPGYPLNFMGAEWGAKTPFHFFASHMDPKFFQKVQDEKTKNHLPDPMLESTFEDSKLVKQELDPSFLKVAHDILHLRTKVPALWQGGNSEIRFDAKTFHDGKVMTIWRKGRENPESEVFMVLNRSQDHFPNKYKVNFPPGQWKMIFNTGDVRYGGSVVLDNTSLYGSDPHHAACPIELPEEGVVIFEKQPG